MFERVVEAIFPGGELLRAWRLKGGISAEMTALRVSHNDNEQTILIRRYPQADFAYNAKQATVGYRLLTTLQQTNIPAPRPILADTTNNLLATPFLATDYIEGAITFSPANLADAITQFATALAEIHRVPIDDFAELLPEKSYTCTESVPDSNSLIDKSMFVSAMTRRNPTVSQNEPVLLHGDFWLGNILWQNEQLVGVIDWEDAAIGDPLHDLATTRLEVAWLFGLGAMEIFTARYLALNPIDTTDLAFWDLCAALRLGRILEWSFSESPAFIASFGRTGLTEHNLNTNFQVFVSHALVKPKQ